MNGRVYDARLGRFLSPDPYVQSPFSQSFNRYSYVVNNPLKYIDPDGYRRQPRTRANPDELPPPQNNIGGGFINNNPNSPGYYPPIGGAFSSISGNIGDPFSIGWGSWVNSFGKYTYHQSLNLRFWNSLTSQILNYGNEYIVTPIRALGRITFVGSFGPLGKGRFFSNGAISFENPTSGVHLSVANVVSSRVAANGGGGVNPASAYWHYKFGEKADYHVDISQVNWSMLSAKDFPDGVGSIRQINIFNIKPFSTAGIVFGDIRLQYLGNNQIKVADVFGSGPLAGKPYFDTYNYNVRWEEVMNGQNIKRNIITGFGWIGVNLPWHPLLFNTYGGDSYKFIFHGTGTIGGGQ
jgi:hypothetical protein